MVGRPHARHQYRVPRSLSGGLQIVAKFDARALKKDVAACAAFATFCKRARGCEVVGDAGKRVEDRVLKIKHPLGGCIVLASVVAGISSAAVAAADFPLVGDYTQNVACKGDGSDPATAKVMISAQEIVSNVGICTILDTKKNGSSYAEHVECKFPSGPLMGNITLTPKPDNTVEFVDSDMTYRAVLYRCPDPMPAAAGAK